MKCFIRIKKIFILLFFKSNKKIGNIALLNFSAMYNIKNKLNKEMKKLSLLWAAAFAVTSMFMTSCKDEEVDPVKPTIAIVGSSSTSFDVKPNADVAFEVSVKKGDKIFGFNDKTCGGHGEYLSIPETDAVINMPANRMKIL